MMAEASQDGLAPDLIDRMIEIRRHLHAHPNLSNDESETQRYLLAALTAEGIEGVRPVADTGLAVDIVGAARTSNRRIAIRGDIDALPIQEDTGLAFASRTAGIMHACGHDAHAAMVFAAAAALHRDRQNFGGTVRFIFQPAEEAEPLGGRRIVGEGLLDDIDAAIGIHVDPHLSTGLVAVGSGPYTLASDIFDITVTGRSAHAAKPFEGVDAIAVGCAVVGELQKIVSREADPFDALIVSVTSFQGGNSYNVLAEQAVIKGTIRSGKEATRAYAQRRLREIAVAIASAHGAQAQVDVVRGEPPVVNDPDMVDVIAAAVGGILGEAALLRAPGWTAADDFGFYSEKVPSVYFRLGVRDDMHPETYPLHHPKMHVDERALPLGAMTLIAAARLFLAGHAAEAVR